MKSAVFYLSAKPARDRQPIDVDGQLFYIRVQICPDTDCGQALDEAEVRLDETLMNSHNITPWEI